jgi:hypothetical protein
MPLLMERGKAPLRLKKTGEYDSPEGVGMPDEDKPRATLPSEGQPSEFERRFRRAFGLSEEAELAEAARRKHERE